jgi:single-strand DNA-binding protein
MNTITIEGFLGKPAEARITASGKHVTNLTVAHTPREKRDGEWVNGETIWFIVPVWDNLPAIMFDKGTRVTVTGQLTQRSYEHEGVTRVNLEIKNATVGIVHRFNKTEPTPPQTTEWSQLPVEDEMPF